MNYGLGCNPDNGQLAVLDSRLSCAAAAPTEPMPAEVDPPLDVNDQLQFNSCCGNADDKASEFDHWAETGVVVNLSARFSYLTAKLIEGSSDSDNGAQIGSAGLASQKYGKCLEETFPYWRQGERYSQDIPEPAFRMGLAHQAGAVHQPNSVDQMLDMIGSLQAASIFGIFWYSSLAGYDGQQEVITRVGGGSGGGHALCCCGYKTIAGQRVPKIWNSHSRRWGRNGTMLMDPDLFWQLVTQAPFGIRAITKLPAFATRKFKHRDGGYC
jgi:hypothetical protein